MKNQPYKCIMAVSMAYMSLMICSDLLVNKLVIMPFGFTTAATLVFPLWFVFNDIIAEVYGYSLSQKMLWTGFIIQIFFDLICYGASNLPSPSGWNQQGSFDLVLGHLVRIALGTLASYLIGGLINVYLITRWKFLTRGRYFWLRSIGSSIIGETFYCALNVWVILLGSIASSKIPMIICWSFFLKVTYTIVLAYPATLIVQFLKNKEEIDVYDNTVAFNPFRRSIDNLPEISNFTNSKTV